MMARTVVLVLGMHRSGTSALTRGLTALGVDLGESLIAGVQGINDRGFWEDRELNSFNESLLVKLGSSWDRVAGIDDNVFEFGTVSALRKEAARLLEEKLAHRDIFGLKDPRMSLLLRFWRPVFQELGIEPRFLISVRNPLDVAASLRKRDGFLEIKSLALWAKYSLACIRDTEGGARVFTCYDTLLQSPGSELDRIASRLGLPLPGPQALAKYASEFLSEDLRHHSVDRDALHDLSKYPPVFRVIHDFMSDAATDAIREDTRKWRLRWSDVQRDFEMFASLLHHVDAYDSKLQQVQNDGANGPAASPTLALARRLAHSRVATAPVHRALETLDNVSDASTSFCQLVYRWNLESMGEGPSLEFDGDRAILRGWVLGTKSRPVHVAVRQDGVCRSYPLNEERPDVLEAVLKQHPNQNTGMLCGFRFSVGQATELDFGFEVDGRIAWAYHMVVSP
jgi:hypothetical protein